MTTWGDVPGDLPGSFWRIERRWWRDGSSCLHIAKWAVQPETGRPAPWWPPQYSQVPWPLAAGWVAALATAVQGAEQVGGQAILPLAQVGVGRR